MRHPDVNSSDWNCHVIEYFPISWASTVYQGSWPEFSYKAAVQTTEQSENLPIDLKIIPHLVNGSSNIRIAFTKLSFHFVNLSFWDFVLTDLTNSNF